MHGDRWLSVPLLDSLEGQRVGCLGSGGVEGGISHSLLNHSSTIQGSDLPGQLFPWFHQGAGSGGGGVRSTVEGGSGTGSSNAGVLQSGLRGVEGFGDLAPYHRLVRFEQVCDKDQVQDGDRPVGSVFRETGRLDGVSGSEGRLPSDSNPSGEQTLPSLFHRGGGFSIQGSSFWLDELSSGLHTGDGSGVRDSAFNGHSDAEVLGRLACPSLESFRVPLCEGSGSSPLPGVGDCCQLGEVPANANPGGDLLGDGDRCDFFEGFPNSHQDPDSCIAGRRVPLLRAAARRFLEKALGPPLIDDAIDSGRTPQDEVPSTHPSSVVELPRRGSSGGLVSPGQGGLELVDRARSFAAREFVRGDPPWT